MPVEVELFGIPRARAKTARMTVQATNLAQVLAKLAERHPGFAESCLDRSGLAAGIVANINGERFVSDPSTPLQDGDSVLILSGDAGG